jgi:hypothetical protein
VQAKFEYGLPDYSFDVSRFDVGIAVAHLDATMSLIYDGE